MLTKLYHIKALITKFKLDRFSTYRDILIQNRGVKILKSYKQTNDIDYRL